MLRKGMVCSTVRKRNARSAAVRARVYCNELPPASVTPANSTGSAETVAASSGMDADLP